MKSEFWICLSSPLLCLAHHFKPILAGCIQQGCIQISLIAIYQIRNSLLLSEWSLKKVRILLRRKNIYFFALDFVSHTEIAMLGVN